MTALAADQMTTRALMLMGALVWTFDALATLATLSH